jgi:23S rRNA (adenine2030-N6)-methyltransferase
MNYRHHFHAGNFADVMKHALLLQLLQALQKKEKGFFYLDTHAGRGRYDLRAAATGATLARAPEWPEGVGRLWARAELPPFLQEYGRLVAEFDRAGGNRETAPRYYPGSPQLARSSLRAQDRMAACELHPEDAAALRDEFAFDPRVTVEEMDGYAALRALLPPRERRGLVLIDPPFEARNEFAQIARAVAEGLERFRTGVYAIWYPITERARVDDFLAAITGLRPPPTLTAELMIAGPASALKMKGCGLVVINPPWQFDATAESTVAFLAAELAQAAGAGGQVQWLARE